MPLCPYAPMPLCRYAPMPLAFRHPTCDRHHVAHPKWRTDCTPAIGNMSALLERRREASASTLPVRVLIVDDDPAYLAYAAALTRRIGFTVETAADGEAALARLAGGGFDVAII